MDDIEKLETELKEKKRLLLLKEKKLKNYEKHKIRQKANPVLQNISIENNIKLDFKTNENRAKHAKMVTFKESSINENFIYPEATEPKTCETVVPIPFAEYASESCSILKQVSPTLNTMNCESSPVLKKSKEKLSPVLNAMDCESSPLLMKYKEKKSPALDTMECESSSGLVQSNQKLLPVLHTLNCESSQRLMKSKQKLSPVLNTMECKSSRGLMKCKQKLSPVFNVLNCESSPGLMKSKQKLSPVLNTMDCESSPGLIKCKQKLSPVFNTLNCESSPGLMKYKQKLSPALSTMKCESSPGLMKYKQREQLNFANKECMSPITSAVKPKSACSTPYNLKLIKGPQYIDDDIFADCDLTGIFEDTEKIEMKTKDISKMSVETDVKTRLLNLDEITSSKTSCENLPNCALRSLTESRDLLAASAVASINGSMYVIAVSRQTIFLWKTQQTEMKYEKIAEQSFTQSVERAFLYPLNSEREINFLLVSISNKSTFLSVISYSEENKLHLIAKNSNGVVICSSCNLVGCVVDSWSIIVAIGQCSNLCCTNAKETRTLCLMCMDLMYSKKKNEWRLNIDFLTRELPLKNISFMQKFSSDIGNNLQSLLFYQEEGTQFGVVDLNELVILDKFSLDIPCSLNDNWNILWANVIEEHLFIVVQTRLSIFIATADPSSCQIDQFHTWILSDTNGNTSEMVPVITYTDKNFFGLFQNGTFYELPIPAFFDVIPDMTSVYDKL